MISRRVVELPEDAYGSATARVREILRRAASFTWFPARPWTEDARREVTRLLARHIESLNGPVLHEWGRKVVFLSGDVSKLCAYYERVNLPNGEDRDLAYDRGVWRSSLKEFVGNLEANQHVRSRAVPPLFVLPSSTTVVLGPLVASLTEVSSFIVPDERRDMLWQLMSDVETDFWSAIISQLAEIAVDPFDPLLQMYEYGSFPLGLSGDEFFVFARSE